ncbi:MAG TPA: 3-phosphoserine/phosphohydroxythreonine transaminase [Lacibacter sp.]|nr:3-phosphoserine/phosphohydroxythreonine transaminase [Lacibacter sp.]HMO88182.1 3-phosphoserine/phosphohydroxythreonine transaminase [Lacibacter sp.]HMP86215.1 3-phosphoserine/phosphohydroxythreonine transaminase [Lacibacter sp.]
MVHNFNAGPGILPPAVLRQAAEAVLDFNGRGLSLLEIGHRTAPFVAVMDEARALVKELMQLDDRHHVLFLHGGASTQFMQVPMNLLDEQGLAAYTETGTWSNKAIREGRLFGHVEIAGSAKDSGYTTIPRHLEFSPTASYLHLTTNETISGTQWQHLPYDAGVPLVADMSSDILSRVLDFNRFDLIYAGAQKNMGAAGVNLVVVNEDILGRVRRTIPTMMDYRNHIKEGSMLNTPPVFAVYVVLLTLRWLKEQGGVAALEDRNREKSDLLYATLASIPFFRLPVAEADRSRMNVVFTLPDPTLEAEFLEICKANQLYGVKGHRSVGGFRVSLYNALPLSSVQVLVDILHDFARTRG